MENLSRNNDFRQYDGSHFFANKHNRTTENIKIVKSVSTYQIKAHFRGKIVRYNLRYKLKILNNHLTKTYEPINQNTTG